MQMMGSLYRYNWRITTWWGKLLYAIGAWLIVAGLLTRLLVFLGAGEPGLSLFKLPMDIAVYVIGARIFRGKGETTATPRPWWQMTAKPKLSRRLGIIFVVLFFLSLMALLASIVRSYQLATIALDATTVVECATLAYLYLNSAARLKRAARMQEMPVVAAD